jgi:hypothetical protein
MLDKIEQQVEIFTVSGIKLNQIQMALQLPLIFVPLGILLVSVMIMLLIQTKDLV